MGKQKAATRVKAVNRKTADIYETYAEGLCYKSVCTNVTDRTRIEQLAGPSGTRRGWKIDEDGTFVDGTPMPAPCSERDGCMHWLLSC